MTNTNINSIGARLVGVDDPTRDDHAATKGYVDAHGGGGSVSVTDGSTTVTGLTELDFTSGATVTDAGGGVAQVAIAGGGSLPDASTEGVVLRAAADTSPEWSDVFRILDDGNVVMNLVDGNLSVELGVLNVLFFKIDGSGKFEVFNDAAEKILDVRPNSVTMGGTTGTPHTVLVDGSLGIALLDENGNVAVQVDTAGNLLLPSIPTSNPAVAGAVWNNAGTLKISAG